MSTSSLGMRFLRVSEAGILAARSHVAPSPCCRSLLRDAVHQHHARHRQQQLHTSTRRKIAAQLQNGESAHAYNGARSRSYTDGAGRSGSRRGYWQRGHSSGGRSSSSRPPPPRAAWLLIPLSLSKMRLDDNAHHNATFAEQAHDFYEHAKDLTLNEKASLLEEGEQLSLWDRFLTSIHRYIIEPIGTARRFLYLAILFLPVIVTAPILALELLDDKQSPSYSRRRKNRKYQERTTTRWWYRFLVHQMERAGPTFIKVSIPTDASAMIIAVPLLTQLSRASFHPIARTMGRLEKGSFP